MDDTIYTIEEVAAYLKVSVAAVKNWVDDGKIETTYVGSERRISDSGVRKFLADSKAAAQARKGSRKAYNALKRARAAAASPESAELAADATYAAISS